MSRNPDYYTKSQNPSAERVGDMTGQPPTNEAADREKASRLANMLEDLQFPATEEIRDHVNKKSPSMGNETNEVMESVVNGLKDGARYQNAYEVEKAAGLVRGK